MIAKEIGVEVVPINPLNYHWKDEMIQIATALNKNNSLDNSKN